VIVRCHAISTKQLALIKTDIDLRISRHDDRVGQAGGIAVELTTTPLNTPSADGERPLRAGAATPAAATPAIPVKT